MSMKEISPVSFGGGAERLGMVSMHSRCLPWPPDSTWSLQRWVRESKRKKTKQSCFSKHSPIHWNQNKKKKGDKSMLTLFCSHTGRHITYCFSCRLMSLFCF